MNDRRTEILMERIAGQDDDTFGYCEISKSIAETIITNKPPFVYAICGGWGTGKSSFLNLMVNHFFAPGDQKQSTVYQEKNRVVTYFNAWRASLHSDILFAFVYEIFTQLRESKAIRSLKMEKKLFKKSIKTITNETAKILGEIKSVKPLLSAFRKSAGFFDKDMVEVMKSAEAARASFEDICRILKNEITVYVIIDELDRCTPAKVVKIIESIRMLFLYKDELEQKIKKKSGTLSQDDELGIPFKYIISFDEQYVAKAFREHYHLDSLEEAFEYISKFIQFKYHFTKRNFVQYIKSIIDDFSFRDEYFPLGSEVDLSNIINALNVEHPRQVRKITVYLIEWQKRFFDDSFSDKKRKLFEKISQKYSSDEYRSLVLRTINCYLFLTASIKVHFPAYYDTILQKDIIRHLPEINTDKTKNGAIFRMFDGERIDSNTDYGTPLHEDIQEMDENTAIFLLALWNALLAIDKNRCSIDNRDLEFSKEIHKPQYSSFMKELLSLTFSN